MTKPVLRGRGIATKIAAATLVAASSGAWPLATQAAAAPGQNLSPDPYYPLIVGATWKYEIVGSGVGAGKTFTIHVASGAKTAAGEAANIQISTGTGVMVTAKYLIKSNGTVEVQGSVPGAGGSGGVTVSYSGGGSYFIPNASQVVSCAPCTFSGSFTVRAEGVSILEHLTQTATARGAHTVSYTVAGVHVGPYTAHELAFNLKLTGGMAGVTTVTDTSYNIYLVKNIGLLEETGGTTNVSVMGHTITSTGPSEELVSYTP